MASENDTEREPLLAGATRMYGAESPRAPRGSESARDMETGAGDMTARCSTPGDGGLTARSALTAGSQRTPRRWSLRAPRNPRCEDAKSPEATPRQSTRHPFWAVWRGPVVDSMTYKAEVLTSWTAVFNLQGVTTAFQSPSAWLMMFRLLVLAMCTAGFILLVVPNPSQMKTSKFQKIAVFLRVFVGLLLGFFLTSSVNRWFECTKGFLELYDAIRNLQMQLLALGVPRNLRNKVVRYGVVSGWLLGMTLQIEAIQGPDDKESAVEEMYDTLRDDMEPSFAPGSPKEFDSSAMHRFTVLTDGEINTLKGVTDPASMMWIWVASLVGRMAQDGWIPPMQSPTYGLIISIAQEAHLAIRNVRQSVMVQAPFIYVHMLASLVHVNNIVNAISFGIVMGSTVGTSLQYLKVSIMYNDNSRQADMVADLENLIISFVICMVGPFLYQVLLEVCIYIAQPFVSEQSQIPTDRLMERLQKDLADAARMASRLPSWDAPFFKDRRAENADNDTDHRDKRHLASPMPSLSSSVPT